MRGRGRQEGGHGCTFGAMLRSSSSSWAGVLIAGFLVGCGPAEAPLPRTCAVTHIERVGGPIALVDVAGRPVSEADFAGAPTLLYFGFANCPAICPTALQTVRAALEARPRSAPPVRVAMITVDPARDTPQVLGKYVASPAFPEGLIGLSGTPEQVQAATTAFKVLATRVDDPGSAAGYTVDHSSLFYLMGPDWRIRAMFPDKLTPTEMAACIDGALAKRR